MTEQGERRLFVGGPLDGTTLRCARELVIAPVAGDPFVTVRYLRRWFGVTGCVFPVMTIDGRAVGPTEVYLATAKALDLPTRTA